MTLHPIERRANGQRYSEGLLVDVRPFFGGLSLWMHNRIGVIPMNKLSIHGITEITISKEVFENDELYDFGGAGFTVVNVTAIDDTGRSTRLTCFVEPGFALHSSIASV